MMMKQLLSIIVILFLVNNIEAKLKHTSALNKGLKYYRNHDIEEELRGLNQGSSSSSDQPVQQWFEQNVDHFDPLNQDMFKQQYYVNDTYWTQGGPIFILLGGEGPIAPSYVQGHFILNTYAEKFGALIVAVEHRFYGYSMPTSFLDTYSLRFLTTQQALADYAVFRNYIVEQYQAYDSKWISFGGSYSGSLSAWFRLKYPQLIDAAIASSAPVQAQLDFPEYFEVVSASLGPQCSAVFSNITQQVTSMIQNGQSQEVETLFQACNPIETNLDFITFMESLSGAPSEIVQYNNDNKATFTNIESMCSQVIGNGSVPSLQLFASFNQAFNNYSGDNCTTSSYWEMVEQLQDISVSGENAASRSWTFQTCIEYGYFQTAESSSQPFSNSITLDYFVQQCTDIFGPAGYTYQPATTWINNEYGGQNNLQATELVMARGNIDPWKILGVANATNPTISTILLSQNAHCSDLYAPLPSDPADLVQARVMAVNLINSVLNN